MAKESVEAGDLIHASNERVGSLEIVIKGSFIATSGEVVLEMPYGSIIGLFEKPGELYNFDYEAKEDSMAVSYTFRSPESLITVLKGNPQITPLIASAVLSTVQNVFVRTTQMRQACKDLADQLGINDRSVYDMQVWRYEYFMALRKAIVTKDIALCTGVIFSAYEYLQVLIPILNELIEKKSEYSIQMASRVDLDGEYLEGDKPEDEDAYVEDSEDTPEALSALIHGQDDGEDSGETAETAESEPEPAEDLAGALDEIVEYSGIDSVRAEKFKELITAFTAMPDKSDTGDEVRRLRKQIAEIYYDLYEGAFKRSLTDRNMPVALKMFFYFGFVSRDLAGAANTESLRRLAEAYVPDPEGNVITMYEWLRMIFEGKVEPSKNEFDMEYPKYLKQQYTDGEIDKKQLEELADDRYAKVSFEIHNLMRNGSKVTFGRISSFVPVFTEDSVFRTPDKNIATAEAIHETMDMVRRVDFSCFTRQMIYSNPKIGINREFIDTEVLPYIILMPNGGTRSALWQEISGAKRDTPGRMMLPIFPEKDVNVYMLRMCGEFRWEMCRREQGVHWNDVTVPSLTSLFSDYLQFYRKNHDLSPELREKIKAQLQAARNSSKAVFVADYINYIAFESSGSLRLNKASREIIFRFCPFNKEIREKLTNSSPAYQKLIERYNIKLAQRKHLLDIVCTKVDKAGAPIPKEIRYEIAYLEN